MNWCAYSLAGRCMEKAVGVSPYCDKHLVRQQKLAQWRLENGKEKRAVGSDAFNKGKGANE